MSELLVLIMCWLSLMSLCVILVMWLVFCFCVWVMLVILVGLFSSGEIVVRVRKVLENVLKFLLMLMCGVG